MDYVVYDTNIASFAVRGELPASLAARSPGAVPVISFVTVGKLEKWAEVRTWGARSRAALDRWINHRPMIDSDQNVSRIWGRLAAAAQLRGRRNPGVRRVARASAPPDAGRTMTGTQHWRRELTDFILVNIDGQIHDIDADVTTRTPARVVIAMPDFTADAVAHVLDALGELADRIHMDQDWTGERELAAALRDAVNAAGYQCPKEPAGSDDRS